MIAAAIAKEIGAKFCSVKPSDLLQQGAGNTEKAVRTLFSQARKFPCAVIYFDEMDSISPKSTRSQYAKQLRSEFLAQLQGVESYGKDKGNILFLICATNKPWDIDSAFLRPGRFGTKVYVGLPDAPAREYMVNKRIEKIAKKGIVEIQDDLDIANVVEKTNGFNGSDITNLLDRIEELSIIRGIESGEKYIGNADFENALNDIHSSVQTEDLIKLKEWRNENDK
jgi:transitional endoplasmic reticulum ATPase